MLVPHAAQASVFHSPLPPGPYIVFEFPGYTSLHDCSFFQNVEKPLSPGDCVEALRSEQELARDPDYANSEYFQHFIGEFGSNPLLYAKAIILYCNPDCRELQPHRTGPPEMMWHPPDLENQLTRLIYPLQRFVPRKNLRLSLSMSDGKWQSNEFAGPWYHSYMTVQLNDANHSLLVEHDWGKTLGDRSNHFAIWHAIEIFIYLWIALLLLAVPGLLTAKLQYGWCLSATIRILLLHAVVLVAGIALFALCVSNWNSNMQIIFIALLFYLGSLLPEYSLFQRRNRRDKREMLRAQTYMHLPFILLLTVLLAFN